MQTSTVAQWVAHTEHTDFKIREARKDTISNDEISLGSLRNKFRPCLCLIAIPTKALLKKGNFFNILSNYISIQMEHELAIDSANWESCFQGYDNN